MMSMIKGELGFARQGWCVLVGALFLAGCASAPGDAPDSSDGELSQVEEAVTATPAPEDGLADAFDNFLNVFVGDNFESQFLFGYAFHPGLSTETVKGASG